MDNFCNLLLNKVTYHLDHPPLINLKYYCFVTKVRTFGRFSGNSVNYVYPCPDFPFANARFCQLCAQISRAPLYLRHLRHCPQHRPRPTKPPPSHQCLVSIQPLPKFPFPDHLRRTPDDHPRSTARYNEVFEGMKTVTEPAFRDMMVSGCFSCKSDSPVTVVIPDGLFSFALDVAEEIQIPLIYFETVSIDLDVLIKNVPGTEAFLRRRDLPGFYRYDNLTNPVMQIIMNEARQVPRAHALDASILDQIRSLCPNIYCIGPLHTLLKSHLPKSTQHNVSNSLWTENRDCLSWLDTQLPKSVVYVSIGSMATMTVDQFVEIWHGLVNSGYPFLFVKRPGSVTGDYDESNVQGNLVGETNRRGFITTWVPQEEVLSHSAIGGFLTHSGWNSTVESMVEGVPMICWPLKVDQHVNSWFVSEVWKIGIDIKDTCDRFVVEKAVKDVLDVRRSEFFRSAKVVAEAGAKSVSENGSSWMDLNRLVEDLKSNDFRWIWSLPLTAVRGIPFSSPRCHAHEGIFVFSFMGGILICYRTYNDA
uniref:Glycosyltransferase n=1 Tax=Lactuca sativa TaxID=4236 RepID=A0A9R1XP16_LACSA|nr:hypothetical protein LSAT_V11C200064020 [Lactuca sativa]